MPTNAERPDLLVDTSVAVAIVLVNHEHHARAMRALRGRRLGLSGHAAFESLSVLTRLPAPNRRSPAEVHRALTRNFPATRFLSPQRATSLHGDLADLGISGGSVYDALVGACAEEHGLPLASLDRRALATYRAVGADAEVILGRA